MPFQMTHLLIAKNVHRLFPGTIKESDLPQFYLGTIAPDAVHYRPDYVSDFKKAAHLCVGDEPWGMLTNNDEWVENVLKFLNRHKGSSDYCFVLGYCCHILSDIYNNIALWTPYRLKYQNEFSKGYGGLYHQESKKVDTELGLRKENRDDFWIHLEKAEPITLKGIISTEEVEKHKENVLHNLYKDKEHPDLSSNKLVTIESTLNFIDGATGFIESKLKGCLRPSAP
jgi:hypothetical protein